MMQMHLQISKSEWDNPDTSLCHQFRAEHEFRAMGPDFPIPCLIQVNPLKMEDFASFH